MNGKKKEIETGKSKKATLLLLRLARCNPACGSAFVCDRALNYTAINAPAVRHTLNRKVQGVTTHSSVIHIHGAFTSFYPAFEILVVLYKREFALWHKPFAIHLRRHDPQMGDTIVAAFVLVGNLYRLVR